MTSTTSKRQLHGLLPTSLCVDHFAKPAIPTIFFLSHFHADHYKSLSSNWRYGPILCSEITKNLIIQKLHVQEKYLHVLTLNKTVTLKYSGEVLLQNQEHQTTLQNVVVEMMRCTLSLLMMQVL